MFISTQKVTIMTENTVVNSVKPTRITYTSDLRNQILEACSKPQSEGGLTSEQAAEQFGPCVNTINKWRREAKKGEPLSMEGKALLKMALKDEYIVNTVLQDLLDNDHEFQRRMVNLFVSRH